MKKPHVLFHHKRCYTLMPQPPSDTNPNTLQRWFDVLKHELLNPISNLTLLLNHAPFQEAPQQQAAWQRLMQQSLTQLGMHLRKTHLPALACSAPLPPDNACWLPAVVYPLCQTVAIQAQQQGLVFRFEAEEAVPSYLAVNAQALSQTLDNLLTNALKYTSATSNATGQQASIALSITATSQHVVFCVSDTGQGIPFSQQHALGQPYHRGLPAQTHQCQGQGLGLYAAHKHAQAMDGALHLSSVPACGTSVWLTLPYKLPATPPYPVPLQTLAQQTAPLSTPDEVQTLASQLSHLGVTSAPTPKLLWVDATLRWQLPQWVTPHPDHWWVSLPADAGLFTPACPSPLTESSAAAMLDPVVQDPWQNISLAGQPLPNPDDFSPESLSDVKAALAEQTVVYLTPAGCDCIPLAHQALTNLGLSVATAYYPRGVLPPIATLRQHYGANAWVVMCADGEPAPDVERWLSDPEWQRHGSPPLLMKDHHQQLTQVLQRINAQPKGVSCVPVASVEAFAPAFLQALGLLRWRNVTLLGLAQQMDNNDAPPAVLLACQQLGMGLQWQHKVLCTPAVPAAVPSPAVVWCRLDTDASKLSVQKCISMVLNALPQPQQRYTLWGIVLEVDAVLNPTWLKRFKTKLATLLSVAQPPVVVHTSASPSVGATLQLLWQGLQQQQALAHTQSYFRQHPLVLLEDNPVSRLILTHQMADESLSLLSFESSTAFVNWLHSVAQPEGQWPGLILADHHLADGDVLNKTTEWCEAGLPTTTPVLLLSAYCDAIAPLPVLQATCLLPLMALLDKPLATETLLPYLHTVANAKIALEAGLIEVAPTTPLNSPPTLAPEALLTWNYDNLLVMLNHNTALLVHLAGVFNEDALKTFTKVEQAFNQQAWATLYHEAHQLKGSASYFQAEALAERMAELEAWAKQATTQNEVSSAQLAQGSQWLRQCQQALQQALFTIEQELQPSIQAHLIARKHLGV